MADTTTPTTITVASLINKKFVEKYGTLDDVPIDLREAIDSIFDATLLTEMRDHFNAGVVDALEAGKVEVATAVRSAVIAEIREVFALRDMIESTEIDRILGLLAGEA